MKKSSYRIFLLLFDEGIRRENFFSYSWSYSFLLSVPGANAKKVFRRFRRTLPVHGSTSFSIIRTFFCPFFFSLRRPNAGINSRDSSGYTALHYAALNGHK